MVYCSFRYGSSFADFFNFRFFEKPNVVKADYATMGFMYRFHAWANKPSAISMVDDKLSFSTHFSAFCSSPYFFSRDQKTELKKFLNEQPIGKIVVKDPLSTAGRGVRFFSINCDNNGIRKIDDLLIDDFVQQSLKSQEGIYIEKFIEQHSDIHNISPSGVNTIRVITMLTNLGTVDIIGTVFRISVNSPLDNYSKGNLAAEIDIITGEVITGGIRKQAACDVYHDNHPVTGKPILGFHIPFWSETLEMVKKAALIVPQVRSIGWDVAITNNGPILIEGNSKWNKDTWQIPAGYGKKSLLNAYISNNT